MMMEVRFFEGPRGHQAFKANTDALVAVAVRRGCYLEVDRRAGPIFTLAVREAIRERWQGEATLTKRRNGFCCSGNEYFCIRINRRFLGAWKTFLTDLLSRTESYVSRRKEWGGERSHDHEPAR